MTQPAPGWYPDPSGNPGQRYYDGAQWTDQHAPPAMRQPTAVVEGPNHALHGILTLFTFWLCGGWGWIWLIVAIMDKKRVRYL